MSPLRLPHRRAVFRRSYASPVFLNGRIPGDGGIQRACALHNSVRAASTSSNPLSTAKAKQEGDISSVFASLSKEASQPLPERFVKLKQEVVGGNIDRLYESWKDLLSVL